MEKVYVAIMKKNKVLLVNKDESWDLPEVTVRTGENQLEALFKSVSSQFGELPIRGVAEYNESTVYFLSVVGEPDVSHVNGYPIHWMYDSSGNMQTEIAKKMIRAASLENLYQE